MHTQDWIDIGGWVVGAASPFLLVWFTAWLHRRYRPQGNPRVPPSDDEQSTNETSISPEHNVSEDDEDDDGGGKDDEDDEDAGGRSTEPVDDRS